MNIDEKRAAYIEETGLFFEALGMTRMAGRIQGYLMVADKEMVSFDELTRVLHASKSSISTNLKALVQVQFIKPVTLPGKRKTYYRLSSDISWEDYFEKRMKALDHLLDIYKRGLELRADKNDKSAQWLEKTIEFYSWLSDELPKMMERRREWISG